MLRRLDLARPVRVVEGHARSASGWYLLGVSSAPLDLDVLSSLPRWPADVAVQRLGALHQALKVADEPERLAAVARALPRSVAELAPEVALAVQQVAQSLIAHAPVLPADIDRLEPWLRARWLRVGLAVGASGLAESLEEPALHAALEGWSLDAAIDPRPSLRRLLGAQDARLRERGLAELRALVVALAITPGEAGAWLLPLVAAGEASLRARALAMLAEGWLREPSPTLQRERDRCIAAALVDPDETVAVAAVGVAAALGRRDWLRARIDDPEARPALVVAAIDGLGPVASDEDLDVVLERARAEPRRLGAAARRLVLAAHRHGVFVRAPQLPTLVALFDAHPGWSAAELVRCTHIVRHALVEHLATLPADDPRWIRRAMVLAESVGTDAPRVLARQLERASDLAVAEALCEAAGRSAELLDDEGLLRWLDALPEAVIPLLAIKGGEQAQVRLRALVEDPAVDRALRRRALGSLWALSRDREALLRELATRLGPHESGLLDASLREPRDHRVARILAAAPWPERPEHDVEPRVLLEVLCESGDIEQLPRVEGLFRELVVGVVQRALAGDFSIKRATLPELEQLVFRYGRHLVSQGRHVRRHVDHGPQTGRDLVLRFVVDWLDEEPPAAVMVALLEIAARHAPSGAVARRIEPHWRQRQREVRRAAIEAILAAGEDARGLELSLGRLVEEDEPRILVQALAAVRQLDATWAEPLVLRALEHPQMAVKKAAAEALAGIASARAVPTLVGWLAHHDNPGLRVSLREALGRAAGDGRIAVLVEALREQSETRRIELLWDALSGWLPLAAALRLARSHEAAHRRLVEACLAGRVALADASAEGLATALHRARLEEVEARDDPGWRLRVLGFTAEAARALLALRAPEREAAVLATVRPAIAEWIGWLRGGAAASEPGAVTLVLDAAQASHREHVDALLELSDGGGDAVDAGAIVGMIERCVTPAEVEPQRKVRAIERLRRLGPSARVGGLRRWQLLGRLGAVRGRETLWRCLEECRLRPSSAAESTALLVEALQIPAAAPDEAKARTELREQAQRFVAWSSAEREAWLDEVLQRRPLGLAVLEPATPAPAPPFRPTSDADLRDLLTTLRGADLQERERAAARVLGWDDARDAWPEVLEAFLTGRVELSREHLARLAPYLQRWPVAADRQARAAELLSACAPWQRRAFVHDWAQRWEAGDASVDPWLRAADESLLVPLVLARAASGDARLARLLRPSRGLAVRTVLERLGERFGDDVAHLRRAPEPEDAAAVGSGDPLAGRDLEGLVALIEDKGVAKGLAVRAIHALVEHGDAAIAPLRRLVTDRRPPVRSAALRALRRVASREATLDAVAEVLAMETRRDVVVSLMRSLGHGRHEASLGALIERLTHGELLVRQGAHEAIRAWGPTVVPALRRAMHRARPDRRPALAGLVAELEAAEDG